MPSIGLGVDVAIGVGLEGGPVLSPAVSSITPSSGFAVGATAITNLAGTNFVSGCTVTIGGVAATSVVFVSSIKLTCVTPAHAAGAVDVVVTNPDTKESGASGVGLYTYAAAPTVTAITPGTGPDTGATAITNLAGTGFVTGATVTIGGASATSVVFVNSTKLTCVSPAGAAGVRNVVVTNPDTQTSGTSGNGLFAYTATAFDPATLSPDGWWRDYGGAPWTPTSPSAHGNLVALGTAPSVGTAVNGHTPANWPGNRGLQAAQASSNFIGTTNCTIIAFVRASSLDGDGAAWYSEPAIVTSDGADMGMSISTSGVRAGNGLGVNTSYVALAANVWAMVAMRIVGGFIELRVYQPSGHTDATHAVALGVAIDSVLQIGKNWNGVSWLSGDILEALTWKSVALSDANLDSMALDYGNARYALGLT